MTKTSGTQARPHNARHRMMRPSIPSSVSALLFLTLTLTSCGTATKPSSDLAAKPAGEKQNACIDLPEPDWSDQSAWMKHYNVVWTRLGCAQ